MLKRLMLVLVVLGCASPFEPSCTNRTIVFEVMYGSVFYEIQKGSLDLYRLSGWKCTGVTIRNFLGNRVGTEYTCTICD